ncbi:MAG: hypothetical protein AAB074_15430 [Planctomycetota bacterium]
MRTDFDEQCTVGCTAFIGLGILCISGLALASSAIEFSIVVIAVAVFGLFIGLAITLIAVDSPRPAINFRSKRNALPAPASPASLRLEPVPHAEPIWTRGGPAMRAHVEARTRIETIFLALMASVAVQAIAMTALFARSDENPTMAALGAVAFLPVALATLTASRRDGGDCAVTTATLVAVLGGGSNIGLSITVWFAAPPFGQLDPTLFTEHPGRDFLWSPFAGAGGPWFLSGLATLLVARASRPGGWPGSSIHSREAAAWWMNGVPVISLLAYGFAMQMARR